MKAEWHTKKLGEVCQIKPPKSEAKKTLADSDMVSFVPMEDLGIGRKSFEVSQVRRLGEVAGSYTYFGDDDVLLAKITPCFENGKLGIARNLENGIGFGSSEYIVFRASEGLLSEYLYYFLARPSFREEGASRMTGAVGHKRVPMDFIENTQIPVPPLPEQQRIITILDEAFEGIATATANAEKNLANARELFDSSLQAKLLRRGEGWVDKKLGELCFIARGGSPRPIQDFFTTDPDGINWIKIGDATGGGKYIYKTAEKIIPAGVSRSRMVHEGDFLLSNSMSFGHPYILRTSGCIHDGWLVLSEYKHHLNQDYLYYLLGSKLVYDQFDRLAAGSTVRNLNKELAGRVTIPLPSLSEQETIARHFDTLSDEVGSLQTIYQQKLVALDELKKSILNQAFTGKLATNDVSEVMA